MELMNTALLYLVLNIYFEARSEPFEAQVDVAHVVLNRVRHSNYPDTIEDVIKQYKQFSWYWDGKSDKPKNRFAFKEALRAAIVALNTKDTTGGALYYYNPHLAKPEWALNKKFTKASGKHIFLGD